MLKLGMISIALAISGCTVLGFATDLALISVSDKHQSSREPNSTNKHELFFTGEGLKHDVKVVKKLIDELSVPSNDLSPMPREDKQTKSLNCKDIKQGKQQCYPAEYYADMYIDDSTGQ